MLHNESNSVHLSDEQTKQLEVFYTRLTNLQTETSIATKILESIKQETVKISLEKRYTEDSLEDLKKKVAILSKEVEESTSLLDESQKSLDEHRMERNRIDSEHAKKQKELEQREDGLKSHEMSHETNVAELTRNAKMLSDERLSVEKAKEAFKKAIESVIWN